MAGRILGPNIAFWNLYFPGREYMIHQEGCKGRIIQYISFGTYEPIGRAFCDNCERWVGKKAWRQVENLLQKEALTWSNGGLPESGGRNVNFRRFLGTAPDSVATEREVIEITRFAPIVTR